MISLTVLVTSVEKIFFIRILVYDQLSYNYYEIGFRSKGLLIVYGLRYRLRYVFSMQFY